MSSAKRKRWAVVRFLGSNCDADLFAALKAVDQIDVSYHWQDDAIEPGQYDGIALPGGFSFGDYLRAGALAKHTRALKNLESLVQGGVHVLGICNGFQILLEMRLLPGYLQVNESLEFISRTVSLEVVKDFEPFVSASLTGQTWRMPIAHRFGSYQCPKLDRSELVPVLRYQGVNPNGSFESIAGIGRRLGRGAVLGMMPHPERAISSFLGSTDGRTFFEGLSR